MLNRIRLSPRGKLIFRSEEEKNYQIKRKRKMFFHYIFQSLARSPVLLYIFWLDFHWFVLPFSFHFPSSSLSASFEYQRSIESLMYLPSFMLCFIGGPTNKWLDGSFCCLLMYSFELVVGSFVDYVFPWRFWLWISEYRSDTNLILINNFLNRNSIRARYEFLTISFSFHDTIESYDHSCDAALG